MDNLINLIKRLSEEQVDAVINFVDELSNQQTEEPDPIVQETD